MAHFDRRNFIRVAAASSLAAVAQPALSADEKPITSTQSSNNQPAGSAQPKNVTRQLASYIVNAKYGDLPVSTRKEGIRGLLNYVAATVGGSGQEAVSAAIAAITPMSGSKDAGLFGRRERLSVRDATFVNGIASHVMDYDDTHWKTIIHPGGPVASAIFALAETRPISGKEFLNAFVLGIEVQLRMGNSVYPNHYDRGWHITGTCGPFGSAAAVGKLLNLTEQQMVWALGLAASQPVGFREAFGSMNKSFHIGRAAENGLLAASLASKNFTSSEGMIEAKSGWANTISTKQDYHEILDGLGTRYESELNTYKPFACGIVLHPAIDAAIQLRNTNNIKVDQVERIDLRVNPYVIELTGKKAPKTGLEGKWSIYHCVAAAVIDGSAGVKQFTDNVVRDTVFVALSERVFPVIDPMIKTDQVDLTIKLKDGRIFNKFIEHALGSMERPMTDKQLEAKFADLTDGILSPSATQRLMDSCWNVETLTNAADIIRASVANI
jgi:2-methylcitrate dehydratase PrpD